jgi:hypothetical protein
MFQHRAGNVADVGVTHAVDQIKMALSVYILSNSLTLFNVVFQTCVERALS